MACREFSGEHAHRGIGCPAAVGAEHLDVSVRAEPPAARLRLLGRLHPHAHATAQAGRKGYGAQLGWLVHFRTGAMFACMQACATPHARTLAA